MIRLEKHVNDRLMIAAEKAVLAYKGPRQYMNTYHSLLNSFACELTTVLDAFIAGCRPDGELMNYRALFDLQDKENEQEAAFGKFPLWIFIDALVQTSFISRTTSRPNTYGHTTYALSSLGMEYKAAAEKNNR